MFNAQRFGHLLFFGCIVSVMLSCGKSKTTTAIEGVTGYSWQVYQVQEVGDSFINPVPMSWQLNLNADRSFSFNLNSSVCSGTYNWMARDSAHANVIFTISSWNNPVQSTALAEKMKRIVQNLKDVILYKSTDRPFPAIPLSASAALLLQGNSGLIYVYR